MAVEVFELRLTDAPGEIWYGVKVNGRSLEAGWADPDAARRRGEEYARELRQTRGRGTVETPRPDEPEDPKIPEPEVVERETERETETETETETVVVPEENGDDGED